MDGHAHTQTQLQDYEMDIGEDVPNQDPIMDAPSCLKYGKDVFVNTHGAGNKLGLNGYDPCSETHIISTK